MTVGAAGHLVQWATGLMPPGLNTRITPCLFDRLVFEPGSAEADPGNLFAPEPELNRVEGGWRARPAGRLKRWATGAAAAVPLVTALLAARRIAAGR